MAYHQIPQGKDPQLWQLAQRRASFKSHFVTYLIMSVVFWIIWYFSGGRIYNNGGLPWPVWPMLGWGIGVAFHYIGAYVAPKSNATQDEYDKLVSERNRPSNL
jgi:uncharacterized RDD family membrane protein YckC